MKVHRIAMGILGALVCTLGAEARADSSLADQLNFLYGERGITLTEQVVPPTAGDAPTASHTAHFTSDSLATLGLLVQTLAPSAADFPAISTVPGLSYRYNPDLQAFERSSGSLGPVYVERPQTLGRGKLDIGLAYLFINFDELDGDELDGLAFRGLQHNDCCGPPSPGTPPFESDTADLFFDQFDIESHVVSLFATYGITDDWDVNILLPIIHTSLEVDARAVLNNESGIGTHSFEPVGPDGARVTEERRSIDDSKTGVGDLQLRTKYHLYSSGGFNLASGLNLRLPTGDEDNLQGLGDYTLTPFFSVAQEYGRFDFHLAAGVEINADDTDRSRVRYAAGVTAGIIEPLAFLVDVVGHSNVTDQDISVTVPAFANASLENSLGEPPPGTDTTVTRELHTDIVDLALGFKAAFPHSLVGFAGVFVPLNDDGLRADVIPTANIEVSF